MQAVTHSAAENLGISVTQALSGYLKQWGGSGGHKHPLSCNPIPIRNLDNVVLPNML